MISKARLKFLRSLGRRKVRAETGLLLLEGVRLVEDAVASGHAQELYLATAAARSDRGERLAAAGLPVTALSDADVGALARTETPAGVFAMAADPCGPFAPSDLPAGAALVVLAARVADPGNLGTLIRSAAALGAAAFVCAPGTVEPTNPKAVRASAGALFRLPVRRGTVDDAGRADLVVWAADAAGAPVDALDDRPARLALAVGSEPHGLPPEIAAAAQRRVAVRLARGVESLNVAVAAGVLLHALRAMPVATGAGKRA